VVELHKWRNGHQLGGIQQELLAALAELSDVRDAKAAAEQSLAEVRGALGMALMDTPGWKMDVLRALAKLSPSAPRRALGGTGKEEPR
jgi:hypothetical protein